MCRMKCWPPFEARGASGCPLHSRLDDSVQMEKNFDHFGAGEDEQKIWRGIE